MEGTSGDEPVAASRKRRQSESSGDGEAVTDPMTEPVTVRTRRQATSAPEEGQ